jgi:hypothetical protein
MHALALMQATRGLLEQFYTVAGSGMESNINSRIMMEFTLTASSSRSSIIFLMIWQLAVDAAVM